jgi:hypothetical protein
LITLEINKTKEIIMKRFALILAALGAFALMSTSAMANDNFYFYSGHGAVRHSQDHAQLNHRALHRGLWHQTVHAYGVTPRQHFRVHQQLNHQAGHDSIRHHSAHNSGRYYGGYGHHSGYSHHSFGVRVGGLSFQFGH